jgi:hypothetical protein
MQQNPIVEVRTMIRRKAKPRKRRPLRIPPVFEMRVALRQIKPPIWRQLLIYGSTSLHGFHGAIQEAFGWQNYHLYEFRLGARRFEAPEQDEATDEDATDVLLMDLDLKPGTTLQYTYDFGDDWEHDIRVITVRAHDPGAVYPYCVDGARAGPPEDCGGPHAYQEFLDILADPKHPEHRERREWAGPHFSPEVFDIRATNRVLELAFNE